MSVTFKPGDRVWFCGNKYRLTLGGGEAMPLKLETKIGYIYFTSDGRLDPELKKSVLKLVKKKKRREIEVGFCNSVKYGQSELVDRCTSEFHNDEVVRFREIKK